MKKCQTENQNRDSYQTGKTVPPKNYQGMITVLLILILFLNVLPIRFSNLMQSGTLSWAPDCVSFIELAELNKFVDKICSCLQK